MDHVRSVPYHHDPLRVPFGAPHAHLEGPALGWPFRLCAFEPLHYQRLLEEAIVEVLEVAPRALERLRRDAGSDVGAAVTEVEDPAVAGALLVHVLSDEDVKILLVR